MITSFQDIANTIHDWYGFRLSTDHVCEVLSLHPDLVADIADMGFDTCNREWFLGCVREWLGMKGGWPLGMDTEQYTVCFILLFRGLAIAKGIELDEDFGVGYGVPKEMLK